MIQITRVRLLAVIACALACCAGSRQFAAQGQGQTQPDRSQSDRNQQDKTSKDRLPTDALVQQGYEHFYNLEYEPAIAAFKSEIAQNPQSPDAHNHLAQAILFRLMYRSGALESQLVTFNNPFLTRAELKPTQTETDEFHGSINRALMLADQRIKANAQDAGAYYAQGVAYGLRCTFNFLVRKAWLDSLKDATAARRSHHQATDIDPSFVDAKMVQGSYDYVVGSLPVAWKMLGLVAGFHGDKDRGMATIRDVIVHGHDNSSDASIMLCAMLRRERRPAETIPFIEALIQKYPRNYLFRLEMVQMYADIGEKDKALAVIQQVDQLKRTKSSGYDRVAEEKIRYTRGNLLFWYNDLDPALEDIRAVLAHTENVDLNTGVYAHLRLGQIYDLKGNRGEALTAYQRTVDFAPDSDAAHEAQRYMRVPFRRRS
jgi:tetratricopeptide (TPR) repeat protein